MADATTPRELADHWQRKYAEIDTASAKIAILEQHGFSPLGYFVLPEQCWLENCDRPMERWLAGILQAHGGTEVAWAPVEAERHEIALYDRCKACFSYGYYSRAEGSGLTGHGLRARGRADAATLGAALVAERATRRRQDASMPNAALG